ncbi:type IV CRISPR-associated DEAD/DEAH-box helicase Csf4 [Paraburkholderia sp. SIMBA_054]|uniref:type IV CRISPR-associated DEAD/DEAH-box helicase Csf4 n=1 Tax=Paraburkholderia sp. SIMBA_054 TaxID=3085795 RepID=UPI00397DCD09
MVFTFSVPETWLPSLIPDYAIKKQQDPALVKAALRDVLKDAVAQGVAPLELQPDASKSVTFTLSLPQPAASLAGAMMKSAGLTAGPLAKRLLAAMRERGPRETPVDESDPFVSLVRKLGAAGASTSIRPGQVELAANVRDALARGKIGLVEGGTGSGKTRVMVACAARYAFEHNCRVVLAAPTLALLRQFAQEYQRQAEVNDMPHLRTVFGRKEFVSEHDLRQMLRSPSLSERYPEVEEWLAAGGPSAGSINVPWLAHALSEIAPTFPVDDVRLAAAISMPTDGGYRAYSAQFVDDDADPGTELLLCTHAMLAQDLRIRQWSARKNSDYVSIENTTRSLREARREADEDDLAELDLEYDALSGERVDIYRNTKGLLPDYQALLLDEGHDFEQNVANALSSFLALRPLVRHLYDFRDSGGRITVEDITRVEGYIDEISRCGRQIGTDMVNLNAPADEVLKARYALSSALTVLDKIPKPRQGASTPKERLVAWNHIRQAIGMLKAINGRNVTAWLRFSPQLRFPSLYLGSTTVERTLTTMWASLNAGAVLSATLYLKRHDGMSAAYQRMRLGIPEERAAEYSPVAEPWSVTPITALYTAGRKGKDLRPPTRADRLDPLAHSVAEAQWLDNLAPYIAGIWATADGGVLVLLPSYANVKAIADRVRDEIPSLVIAVQGYPLASQKRDFLQARHRGEKPVWLSVGGAWTGLDVGGHDPWEQMFGETMPAPVDNVLTDLVIPRLPFGTNQSISHVWRVNNRPDVPWELFETAIRFKQGLGRLVRRDGLPKNRRVWVLDGRIQDGGAGASYALFRQMMSPYPLIELDGQWD